MKMMRIMILALLSLCAATRVAAQTGSEKVELLFMDGMTAVFCSEGFADNKRDAVDHSCAAVLRHLLYNGVEDFNGGYPVVTRGQDTNVWLREFFSGKLPAYKNYVGGVELVGDFATTATGLVSCKTNVMVKWDLLMRHAESQGITGEAASTPVAAPAAVPAATAPKPKRSVLIRR